MTLNTSQVSYYMIQRKKGVTQHISAMKACISVRSGRRIEKEQRKSSGERHLRARHAPRKQSGSVMCFLYSLPARRPYRYQVEKLYSLRYWHL